MSVSDFHGLAVPDGIDRRALYMSSYRQITTYAMPVAELEAEFRRMVQKASATLRDADNGIEGAGARQLPCDSFDVPVRKTNVGLTLSAALPVLAVDVLLPNEQLVHVSMSTCGSQPAICAPPPSPTVTASHVKPPSLPTGQLKYWVDFH